MIDTAAKMAFRKVMRILDEKADDLSNMVVEGVFDSEANLTTKSAADYLLNEILYQLSLQIGQVVAELNHASQESELDAMSSLMERSKVSQDERCFIVVDLRDIDKDFNIGSFTPFIRRN